MSSGGLHLLYPKFFNLFIARESVKVDTVLSSKIAKSILSISVAL